MSFHLDSYKQQAAHLNELGNFTRDDFLNYESSVDAWRHHRMMEPLKPFTSVKDWSFLTIGDTNGWDAARLSRMGAQMVTASDLATTRLEQARTEGIIERFRQENAERMSAGDASFDIVFCKEAFHHMPRPWIGLYEMLRVARSAVILIEPRDWVLDRGAVQIRGPRGLFGGLMAWAGAKLGMVPKPVPKSALFRLGNEPGYEETGNYIFSVSSRELEKVALGMNLPAVAYLPLNDHFEPGLSDSVAEPSNPKFRMVDSLLKNANIATRAGMGSSSLLIAALFITMPKHDFLRELEVAGWHFIALTRNPYSR